MSIYLFTHSTRLLWIPRRCADTEQGAGRSDQDLQADTRTRHLLLLSRPDALHHALLPPLLPLLHLQHPDRSGRPGQRLRLQLRPGGLVRARDVQSWGHGCGHATAPAGQPDGIQAPEHPCGGEAPAHC